MVGGGGLESHSNLCPSAMNRKMIEFNVAQLLKGPIGGTRDFELDDDVGYLDPELHPVKNLVGRVRFIRTAQGVLVKGKAHVSLELICSRCLTPFTQEVEIVFEDEFRPTIDPLTGYFLDVSDVEPALLITKRHMLVLDELIREKLLLAIPMKPLCSPDCKGLCPICGHNLNEGPCEHVTQKKSGHPAWLVLEQLLEK